jgi:integrase
LSDRRHRKLWAAEIERHVEDAIGDMQIDKIRLKDVVRALEPHWLARTDTARRVRKRIERVFDRATVAEYRSGLNPARWRGGPAELMAAPSKVAMVGHHGALALSDVADWFADLRKREGMGARALEFAAMTAARSGDVRGATWHGIDLDAGMWTIPAARMKAGKEHRVPLTAEAVALLRALPRNADQVFPAPRGGQLSDMTLSATMRRMHEARSGRFPGPCTGRPAVPHGLCSTFCDWCAERGVDRDLVEIGLVLAEANCLGGDAY